MIMSSGNMSPLKLFFISSSVKPAVPPSCQPNEIIRRYLQCPVGTTDAAIYGRLNRRYVIIDENNGIPREQEQ